MSKIDDPTRLGHMLESARMALQLISGETRDSLEQDIKLSLALTRLLEIIGEAGVNVSEARQAELSGIEWAKIRGMRNRIVHAYFDVDLDVVWDTVLLSLPPLVAQLEQVIDLEEGV
jgi:uncharacterized protein with HEPN domain